MDNNFYKYNLLTKKAFEFQTQIMSGKTMTFSKASIGDGLIRDDEAENITELKNKITDVKILSVVPNGHTVELTLLLDGDGLSQVTLYREIGIYATIDDEEALYAYLNSDDKFDYIIPLTQGNKREFTNNKIRITLVVGNADNITVSLNNTTIPDNSITMDMLDQEVKDELEDIQTQCTNNINTHTNKSIVSADGVHDLKYDTSGNKLQYKQSGSWHDVPTGQQAESLINTHKDKSIVSADGVHDLKYDTSGNKLQYKQSGSWHDVPTGQQAENLINTHKDKSIVSADGVHDLKYDTSGNKLQYKQSGSWHDVPTGQQAESLINTHANKKISETNGVHGIEYVEAEDMLKITKQNGQTANYKAGVDPDLLFSDLNTGLQNCIDIVGETNE